MRIGLLNFAIVKKSLAIATKTGMTLFFALLVQSCDNDNPIDVGNKEGNVTVTDIDGNVYTTVKIGKQVWTKENLKTTKYNDGTAIQLVTDSAKWTALTTPGYCYYNNTTDSEEIDLFGALYNEYVVNPLNSKKIAPAGWHVPSDAEWDTLQNYLIANGYNWDGTKTGNKIAKAIAAKTEWIAYSATGSVSCDMASNDSSGFSGLPGGCRYDEYNFTDQRLGAHWWSTTELDTADAYGRSLLHGGESLDRMVQRKKSGLSLRLVKDY